MNNWLLVALMMTFSLFACATDKQTHRWTLADTMEVIERVTTEQELVEEIGKPHGNALFEPGSHRDRNPMNQRSRDSLRATEVYLPASLVDELPVGTKILGYNFQYGAALVGGELDVYVSKEGNILGYSYTKTLVGLEKKARMHKRR